MSNQQHAVRATVPTGDFGLGLCVQCLGEVIFSPDTAPPPRFAVTLAPLPQPGGVIPAPACFEHLRESVTGQPGLLVARGGLPR